MLLRRRMLMALPFAGQALRMCHLQSSNALPWDEDDLDSDTLQISVPPLPPVPFISPKPSPPVSSDFVASPFVTSPVGHSEATPIPPAAVGVLCLGHSQSRRGQPGLVLAPQVSPPQLLSVADRLAHEFIPAVTDVNTIYDLVRIFEFPSTGGAVVASTPKHLTQNALIDERKVVVQALRHEGVFKAAYWRVFKWDLFDASATGASLVDAGPGATRDALMQLSDARRCNLVLTTSRLFSSAVSHGFTRDPQLMLSAVGRLIDMSPFMNGAAVADTFDGMRVWGRLHFSVDEVIRDVSNHSALPDGTPSAGGGVSDAAHAIVVKSMASAAGPQSNLVDVLLDGLESQLKRVGADLTVEQLLRTVEGLSHTGVRDPTIIATLARSTFSLEFTPYQTALLLRHAAGLHERIVEVLVGRGGPAATWVDAEGEPMSVEAALRMASPLFVEAAKKIQLKTLQPFGRSNPEVILALRRMCETNALVVTEVPMLWEEIRAIPIPQSVVLADKRKRELGAYKTPGVLQRMARDREQTTGVAFKAKPVVEKGELRDLPPQFKYKEKRTASQRRKADMVKKALQRSSTVRFGIRSTKNWETSMRQKAHKSLRY